MTSSALHARHLHIGLWVVAAASWIGAMITERLLFTKDINCDLFGGRSFFGEAAWSWFPPGRTCTWVIDGLTAVESPGADRLMVPVLLVLWLFAVLSLSQNELLGKDAAMKRRGIRSTRAL